MQKITPFLWFNTQAEDAAKFYTSIFKDSGIDEVTYYGEGMPMPAGSVLTVRFHLEGQPFVALNGGDVYSLSPAMSFVIDCDTQEEVDYYWNKLTADGGQEMPCAWLTDKFGLTWQVVPKILIELLHHKDAEKAGKAAQAMFKMTKIDIQALLDAVAE